MIRIKPGFPNTNCNIKMPDCVPTSESSQPDEEGEHLHRRQQLINFGHSQWGFNNWSWSVSKQELDFVDYSNAKYNVGVVAYVSVTVKTLEIHRENIGYATTFAAQKGSAIYQARKCAVTNALRETLLSFGGSVATDLLDILDTNPPRDTPHLPRPAADPVHENNQNIANKVLEPIKTIRNNIRKDSVDSCKETINRVPHANVVPPVIRPAVTPNPVAKAFPIPVNKPPGPGNHVRPPPPQQMRPNSNEAALPNLEDMSEEDARAERKRRQRQAQEEFRLKQLSKQTAHGELHSDSFDDAVTGVSTQDMLTTKTCADKRRSPEPAGGGDAKKTYLSAKP